MLRGELDISTEAIRIGLARDIISHYSESDGALIAAREIVIDDCSFRLMVLIDELSEAIYEVLLSTTQNLTEKDYKKYNIHPEFKGVPLGITAHQIDLSQGIASIPGNEAIFMLTHEQVDLLKACVDQIIAGNLEKVDDDDGHLDE